MSDLRTAPMRSIWSLQGASLCLLSVVLLFGWLGAGSITNGDDAVYAWAARAMVEQGEWLSYRWHEAQLHTYYPPLHFALLKLSILLLGETEFAFRLPAALAALACVLLSGDIVREASRSRNAGLFAGLSLLTSATFYLASRSVRLDMTFLALGVAAYWAYLRALRDERYVWLIGVFGGLAYLAKSVLVTFVALPIVIDVLWQRREWLRSSRLYGAAGVALMLASLWHVALWYQGRPVIPDYGARVLGGIAGDFTFATMLSGLAEAEGLNLLAFGAAFVYLLFRASRDGVARFCLVAVGCGTLILLITRTAMQHYSLSLFAPLSIGAGLMWGDLIDRRPIFAPAMVCGLLALFARANLALFVDPDFSPGASEIAALAKEGGSSPVLFFRDYSASFDFYLDGETLLLTESKVAYDLYIAHPAMRDGPGLALVSPSEMLGHLSEPSMQVATTIFFQKDLESYLSNLPVGARAQLERKQVGAYVLYRTRAKQ